MPRGVPKNGVRKPRTKKIDKIAPARLSLEVITNETDDEISARIAERFDILTQLTDAAISGDARALIVSGPAGLGKSFTVEEALKSWDPNEINHTIVKGFVRATGLYKLFWQYRHAGKVIVFDDADSIFFDDTCLNLLKAVCDTTENRKVSWLTEGILISEDTGEKVPHSFQFDGTIIFISNYDFDAMIDRGHKLAPHLQALVSRAHYIDLAMKNRRDYIIRIKQVVKAGLLTKFGFSKIEENEILSFVEANASKLRELSLRIVLKMAALRKSKGDKWKGLARVTCCKN